MVRDGERGALRRHRRRRQPAGDLPGIPPDLFREGQGVIATGSLEGGTFVASEILAATTSSYMPKEVADALKAQGCSTPTAAASDPAAEARRQLSRCARADIINRILADSVPSLPASFPTSQETCRCTRSRASRRRSSAAKGGYVNDPDDPGGATNHGVTLQTMKHLGLDLTGDGRVDAATSRRSTRAGRGDLRPPLLQGSRRSISCPSRCRRASSTCRSTPAPTPCASSSG